MPNSTAYQRVEDSIVDDTQRPDLAELDANGSSVIMRRIRRAVLAMHRIDFWRKDFIEQFYVFESSGMIQAIDTNLLPRFRSFGYVRKWDNSLADQYSNSYTPGVLGAPRGGAFTERNPSNLLDGYGYDEQDVMYQSGTLVKLNSSIPIDRVLIGWFQDPLLDPITASTSWILSNYPDLIAAYAKMRIFKNIGKDDEARSAREEYADELMRLQTNNVKLAVLQA